MILLQFRTSFKTIRRPGKSGPAVFACCDPGPSLGDFTKNIDAKAKPSASISPSVDLRAEGFAKPMSSEPAPSHRPWISTPGATPVGRALPYHAGDKGTQGKQYFLGKPNLRACRMRCSAGKTTLEHQNACSEAQTRGCCRSTEVVIVVPRLSWRNIFFQKTCHPQEGEIRKNIGQQSS
jgi:hypothetical protein